MAAWSGAAPARAPARPRPVARPAPRRRAAPRGRTRHGIAWIVVLGALLAGIVALNVAVLQLNMRLDRLGRARADLRAETAALQSQVSSAGAAPKIQTLAAKRLGLVPAPVGATQYVELGR